MSRFVRLAAALAVASIATGCASTAHFESDPPGAQVSYNGEKGAVIGTTPFVKTVNDQFGWFSVYRFTATLDGYEPETIEFPERSPLDAANVVPATVQFKLKKIAPAVAEAPAAPASAVSAAQ